MWRSAVLSFVLCAIGCSFGYAAEIGSLDQKEPPTKKDLVAPKNSDGIDKVDLRATVTGKDSKDKKARIYVLVSPLSNGENQKAWWVQQEVKRDGQEFECVCQFGEEEQGAGEFFAILGILTDKELSVGEMVQGVPNATAYSKLKIVERK